MIISLFLIGVFIVGCKGKIDGELVEERLADPLVEGISNEAYNEVVASKWDREIMWDVVGEARSLRDIADDVHHMSHEVVIAEEKIGQNELTEENINKLLVEIWLVETEPGDQQIKDGLRNILENWKEGNFESADANHNWLLLRVYVGRKGWATYKLTPWNLEKL